MSQSSAEAEKRYTHLASSIREAAKPGDMKPVVAPPDLEMAPGAESKPDRMRPALSLIIFMMTQAVLFGAGMLIILGTSLADDADRLVAPMIVVTTAISAVMAWVIAPRMRARNWMGYRPAAARDGDFARRA